jgi:hypothetical protein
MTLSEWEKYRLNSNVFKDVPWFIGSSVPPFKTSERRTEELKN